MRITSAFLNIVQRLPHGLVTFWQRRIQSQAEQSNFAAMAAPIPYRANFGAPGGGRTNVAANAASYWASLPRLELPDTNLTPHYLEDFIASPPMGAA